MSWPPGTRALISISLLVGFFGGAVQAAQAPREVADSNRLNRYNRQRSITLEANA